MDGSGFKTAGFSQTDIYSRKLFLSLMDWIAKADCGHGPGEIVISPNSNKWSLYCRICEKYVTKQELDRLLWGPEKE